MSEVKNYQANVDKMYTYLKAFFRGADMTESIKALQYAREKHKDQKRKNGVPYIVHPLSMCCYAAALNIKDDNIMATLLLHDVLEDCGVSVEQLPFNDVIKQAVKYMTVIRFETDRDKRETKSRYYRNLLENKIAVVCKAIDRYNNLSDMPFALSADAIGKNAAETDLFLLPILKEAKEKWADLSDILFVLRTNIRSVNDILKLYYEKEYNKWIAEYK